MVESFMATCRLTRDWNGKRREGKLEAGSPRQRGPGSQWQESLPTDPLSFAAGHPPEGQQ
jgi:hypothetical protein